MPILMAGDLNVSLGDLPLWDHYSKKGFLDVGAYFPSLNGTLPEATYRGSSGLDYCIANRALIPFLAGFSADPRGFTDQASLHLDLVAPLSLSCKMTWSMPVDISSLKSVIQALP